MTEVIILRVLILLKLRGELSYMLQKTENIDLQLLRSTWLFHYNSTI